MPLTLHPVHHADILTCITIRIQALGSLVIGRLPEYPGYREEQEARIHQDIDYKPHVYRLKVVDTDNKDTIIAYAKWEVYEEDRLMELSQPQSTLQRRKEDKFWQLRREVNAYFRARDRELGKEPYMLLAKLVTLQEHRRRGAGSLLLQWGFDESEELGLPCYIEASEEGRSLYRKHGFEEIRVMEFDLSEYGLDGGDLGKLTEMVRKPKRPTLEDG